MEESGLVEVSEIAAPAEKRQRPTKSRAFRVAMIGLAVLVAWVTWVGVSGFLYYRSTPRFEDILVSRPVTQEDALQRLPQGELLFEGDSWSVGEPAADEWDLDTGFLAELRINRDGETLIDAGVDFSQILDPESWDRLGFEASVPRFRVREGMRSLIQVSLYKVRETLGNGGDLYARIFVDIVLVAGSGEPLFRVVKIDEEPEELELARVPTLLSMPKFGLRPASVPPEQGLIYQARMSSSLPSCMGEGSRARSNLIMGSMNCIISDNADMYSSQASALAATRAEGTVFDRSLDVTRNYGVNGRVW